METDPIPVIRRWPDPVQGPYTLRVWFGHPNGYPTVVGVEMWGVEPVTQPWSSDGEPSRDGLADTAVTSQAIRIRLGELLDAWIALHGNIAQPAPSPEKATREEMSELLDRARGVQQALFLRQVALEYDTAVRRGDRRPAKAVEEWAAGQEGAPFNSSTVRGWIKRAADQGYLPKTSQGKVRRQEET